MRRSASRISYSPRPASAGLLGLILAAISLVPIPAAAAEVDEPGDEEVAGPPIAVVPLHNRSGTTAPLQEIRRELSHRLRARGFSVLDHGELVDFMRHNRLRHTAGLNQAQSQALEQETGARAALLTSLDLFQESNPPKVALTARLVSTGPSPQILWMDSAAESGDQSPGFLDLGLVEDFRVILDRVLGRLADSALQAALADTQPRPKAGPRRFRPKVAFRSPVATILTASAGTVAVLPLANESTTPYAGEVLTDLLIQSLLKAGADVLEPGVVRQVLLETRQIQPKGPSIPQVDVLRVNLNVDRIVFGEVGEYLEASAGSLQPVVDFSARIIDTASRQVIFSSISHTNGDDGVFFFDVRQIATAHDLAERMTQAMVMALPTAQTRRARVSAEDAGRRTASIEQTGSLPPARSGWYPLLPRYKANQDLP